MTATTEQVRENVLGMVEETREERERFLQELVQIRSPEGEGATILRRVAEILTEKGADEVDFFYPDVDALRQHEGFSPVFAEHSSSPAGSEPVVVGTFKGSGGGRSLMFYGHLESATPSWDPAFVAKMKYDPWAATVAGNKLYGRAAYNMKSGMSAALLAIDCVRRAGVTLQGDLLYNANVDEDVGSNGALASVIRGYRADGGICPEPTGLWICNSVGAPLWFRVDIEGLSTFAGFPGAISAIEKGILVYQAIQEYAEHRRRTARHPMYEHLSNQAPLGVGVFRSGNWPSNLPQNAIIEGRLGKLPGESEEELRAEFEGRIAAVARQDEWLAEHPPTVTWTARWESVTTPTEHPIVQTTVAAYRELLGDEPVVGGKTAGNDMTKIGKYGGVPSVNWGPRGGPHGYRLKGESADADLVDEYVDLDSYHTLTRLFALTILDWCGVGSQEGPV